MSENQGAPSGEVAENQNQNTAEGGDTQVENVQTPDPAKTIVSGDPSQIRLGDPPKDDKQTPAPKSEPASNEVVGEFGDAGDPALNVVYRFVEGLGFKTDDTEIQSVLDSGDFTLLRAKLASMGNKARGWEEYIGIAERHFKNESEAKQKAEQERVAACTNAIHDAVGGQEQWEAIQTWASGQATEEEKEAFNAMLNAGPLQAKTAARQLAENYMNAHGTVKDPASAVSDQASASQGKTFALSPREYIAAVQELARQVGAGRIDDHPEYAKLKQRRAAWRG